MDLYEVVCLGEDGGIADGMEEEGYDDVEPELFGREDSDSKIPVDL